MMASAACDPRQSLDDVSERQWEDNGVHLNGFRLNGFRLNGFRLNGFRLNGDSAATDYIELESIELASCGHVKTSWLEGSNLHVKRTDGTVLSGAQLVGSVLHFGVVEGGASKKKKLKIAGVAPLTSGSEVLQYDLKIKNGGGPWQPLCVDGSGQVTQTLLLAAAWDPRTGRQISPVPSDVVTLACRGAALAKCVEWGYLPWVDGDYHQACTRVARADYCGDGISHTVDGVAIHILDEIGIQESAPDSTYVVEAEWGPDGAVCLDANHTRLSGPDIGCSLTSCGAPFTSGGLIQTGIPTP
ncbi:ADYC domain-containing protein [Nannocystis pusilla]|uniref:ADYC domain-containing protein n=1 Tax=Nannocystis pusilla TaxID=889268 RepID=UPI003B7EB644